MNTNFVCVFIGMKHISPTCIYHTNVFEADNIHKNPPPNVLSPIFFYYFYFAPMTLLTARALAYIPSCPRQLQTCARLMQGRVAPTPGTGAVYRVCCQLAVVRPTFIYFIIIDMIIVISTF